MGLSAALLVSSFVFLSRVLDTRWQELSGKTSIYDTKFCPIRPLPMT